MHTIKVQVFSTLYTHATELAFKRYVNIARHEESRRKAVLFILKEVKKHINIATNKKSPPPCWNRARSDRTGPVQRKVAWKTTVNIVPNRP